MKLRMALTSLLLLAACTAPAGQSVAKGNAHEFAAVLQQGLSYDFDVLTPAQLLDGADKVVLGRVADIVPGRELSIGRGVRHANLVVTVERTIRGPEEDGPLYAELRLPAEATVAQLQEALPAGRLLLFLDDRTDVQASNSETGRPAGARIYTPFAQGLVIEDGGGWVSGLVDGAESAPGWGSLRSFDAVVALGN